MSKIVFIEPKAPNLYISSQFMLPRLGLYILGAMAKHRDWDVEIIKNPPGTHLSINVKVEFICIFLFTPKYLKFRLL